MYYVAKLYLYQLYTTFQNHKAKSQNNLKKLKTLLMKQYIGRTSHWPLQKESTAQPVVFSAGDKLHLI